MDCDLLALMKQIEEIDLLADSPDDVDALMRGLPLLGFWHGQVRWASSAEIVNEEPPEWWEPTLRLQRFAGNMYGDHWCFQPTKEHPDAVTFVAHDLDEAVCFAPSFAFFLFRASLNALTFRSEHTWRHWSRAEVTTIVSAGLDVVGTLVSPNLSRRLKDIVQGGAQFVTEKTQKHGYYSWISQEEADSIAVEAAGWPDLDKSFAYSIPM